MTTNRHKSSRFVFSGCKDNFLKDKNQYFFYKNIAVVVRFIQWKEKKGKNSYKPKNHHVRRDGFNELIFYNFFKEYLDIKLYNQQDLLLLDLNRK